MKFIFLKTWIILLTFSLLFSCAGKKKEEDTAELLYVEAMKLLKDKNYLDAGKEFEKIDDDFPFSKWAIKGQVMATYAYFKERDYDKVVQLSEDFSRLNATSKYMPYMLYLRGLSYYLQIPSIERAQDFSALASAVFRELIIKYPSDDHAIDAKLKLEFIDEHLAGAVLSKARRQIKVQNFVGAINHLQFLINRYRNTKQVAEGYYRLAEIYWYLGDKKEFAKAKNIIVKQFANSYWGSQLAKFE